MKRFQAADVNCFSKMAAIDVHSAIVVYRRNDERSFGWAAHFWLTTSFVGVEHNEDVISWYILFGES